MPKARTQERILAAALAEFAACGFAAASTNRIAAAAGVAKGSVFSHFGTKAGLYGAVFFEQLDRMLAALDRFEATHRVPIFERIVDVLAWKARYAAEHPDASRVLLAAFTDPPPAVAAVIAERAKDLAKTSMRRFFGNLDEYRFRPEFTREDVLRQLEIAANGLQATYLRPGTDFDYLESIREPSINFIKTVIRGMEMEPHGTGL